MFDLNKKDEEMERSSGRGADSKRAAESSGAAAGRGDESSAAIGRSIQISGDVKGDEDLIVLGEVSGKIELQNHSLTVGKEGQVKANVYARSITVDGTTEGDLFASERIAIRSTAIVDGNLVAPRISLEDGARFKGSVEMDQNAVDKALGTTPTPTETKSISTDPKSGSDIKPAEDQKAVASAGR
jgi:cytoskeletal protein CcmA (bactofilin family)